VSRELTFYPEWGAESPVWEAGTMVWLDQLPLTGGLAWKLESWAADMGAVYREPSSEAAQEAWLARGKELFEEARTELAPHAITLVWDAD
jgi:hypothetical protein